MRDSCVSKHNHPISKTCNTLSTLSWDLVFSFVGFPSPWGSYGKGVNNMPIFRLINIPYDPQTQKFGKLTKQTKKIPVIGGGDACQVSS